MHEKKIINNETIINNEKTTNNKKIIVISEITKEPAINIVLDTLERNKQALVFCNSKARAEKTAEDIAKNIDVKILSENEKKKGHRNEKKKNCKTEKKKEYESEKKNDYETMEKLEELSSEILAALPRPTKQCKRLAKCVKNGIAYHHAGLVHRQKELIEDAFRDNLVKIISCTPTLAYGLNLPAFRAVIKDLKRYGNFGLAFIPILEYHQMAGRAGRPGKEKYGEAVCIASTEAEKNLIIETFIKGEPEAIFSKLAVEPVLRVHLLSLIAGNFVSTREQIACFFAKTFWAHQFRDMKRLEGTIEMVLQMLAGFEFIKSNDIKSNEKDFASAGSIKVRYCAMPIGKRVAELYIDPMTAFGMITAMKNARKSCVRASVFSYLHMIANTLEIRPKLKVKATEFEKIMEKRDEYADSLIVDEPDEFDADYDEYINGFKTALFLEDWCNEKDEEYLLERYNVRPGEIKAKLDIADWLMYAAIELCRLLGFNEQIKVLSRARFRLKHGVKDELLALLKLKNIGRVRARKLYSHGIKDLGDIKMADIVSLAQLIGKKTAIDIKEQVGMKVKDKDIKIKEINKIGRKRKGQRSLMDY